MAVQRAYLGGILLVVAFASMACTTQGVTLNLRNNCAGQITAYWQAGADPSPQTAVLAPQGTQAVDVGAAWPAGVVWGGNLDKAFAGLAEFTIVDGGTDTYDISLVDAYNLGIEIQPVTPSGSNCQDISCDISDVAGFCTPANMYGGAANGNSEYCKNVDGPQPPENPPCCCPTDNTRKFKTACPDAYSFSKDDASSTFTCDATTDYNIVFCPQKTSNNNKPCNQS